MNIRQFRRITVLFTSIVLSLGIVSCNKSGGGVTDSDDTNDPDSVATSIEITPDIIDLDHHGGTEEVMAIVKDQFGEEISGLSLTWSVEDEEIALVDTDGTVTGINVGSTLLTVTHDDLSAEVEVNTMLQMNSQCSEASPFPSPGAFGGDVSFTRDDDRMEDQVHPYNTVTHHAYDFDGDGDEDILVFAFNAPAPDVEQGGQVLVWRNDNGSFTQTEEVLEPDHVRADATRQFEVADYNNDGILDLFAAQHGWDTEPFPGAPDLLFLSDGNGGITEKSAESISPYITDGFTHASASGDVDCDQDIDIVVSDLGTYSGDSWPPTRLLLNDGFANFQQTDGQLPSEMDESFVSADMCDIDRDGDLDLFLGAWPAPG